MDDDCGFSPTPEQIKTLTARIRAGWSEEERQVRAGRCLLQEDVVAVLGWTPPLVEMVGLEDGVA